MTARSRVLVVGDVIEDIQVTLSKPPRLDTDIPARIRRNQGGSAANTAVWLAHGGIEVDFWARVGRADGPRLTQEFGALGVNAHLQEDPENETGTIVMIVEGESRTMLSDRGANIALELGSLPDTLLEAAAWLHMTGYLIFHSESPEAVEHLIARARDKGVKVMVDASSAGFLQDFGVDLFVKSVAGAHILRCNKDEALLASGSESVEEAAEILSHRFPTVVVTQGAAGSLLVDNNTLIRVPAFSTQHLVDPTGAGDAYNAGLLAGLMEGLTIERAATQASRLATAAVTQWGARP